MVSILGPAFGALGPAEMYYPSHVPRISASASKSLHSRSSSLPEAVYIAQQEKLKHLQVPPILPRGTTRVRHPSGNPPPPVMVSLRRSHTNVADFGASKNRHFASRPRYFDQSELPVLYTARSRSNIAALGLNPEVVYRPLPNQTKISRASSFAYHHRTEALPSARSLGYLASSQSRSSLALQPQSQSCKDLSQPLHVDCSVEYDLGNQPKIPKDSAPLLIIHPAYQQQKKLHEQQQSNPRFHPYTHR